MVLWFMNIFADNVETYEYVYIFKKSKWKNLRAMGDGYFFIWLQRNYSQVKREKMQ